jgi:hypothetical protein
LHFERADVNPTAAPRLLTLTGLEVSVDAETSGLGKYSLMRTCVWLVASAGWLYASAIKHNKLPQNPLRMDVMEPAWTQGRAKSS